MADNNNNNNNNNNNEEDRNEPPPLLAIQDEEHYIRSHGLRHDDIAPPHRPLCEVEAAERHAEAAAYQDAVHKSIFGSDNEDGGSGMDERKNRMATLKRMEGMVLTILVNGSGGPIENVPLAPLASLCDTVYGLAVNTFIKPQFGGEQEQSRSLQLDLSKFHRCAVVEFLSVISAMTPSHDNNNSVSKAIEQHVSNENIVECCRIAHFLQCNAIVHALSSIMEQSIDSQNCLSLCHFADQFNLPSLFERSLTHMLSTMEHMQNHELWKDLPSDLQNRIVTMRNAIQSSIIGRGRKAKVFFSSSEEFLAIFSDNIREQRERLEEAKRRQEEVVRERVEREERRGFLRRRGDPYGGSVGDAERKIKRQERRIRTLESFYEEQKKIFASGEGWRGMETADHRLAL